MIYHVDAGGTTCFLLNPEHAKILFKEGWGKKELKNYISQNTAVPFRYTRQHWEAFPPFGEMDPKTYPLSPEDPIRLIPNPESIAIVVAGGPGSFIGRFRGGGAWGVTRKVELPANWDKLVARYQDVVPNYVRY
jgi:hypothetical protein